MANRTPGKMDGRGDHPKRESSGSRNDKSHRSESNSRSSSKHTEEPVVTEHAEDSKEAQKDLKDKDKDAETKSTDEKKFTGRCRLFVGNLTPDVSEDDFKKMFEPYGEISEVYVNTGRGFGFIRLVSSVLNRNVLIRDVFFNILMFNYENVIDLLFMLLIRFS